MQLNDISPRTATTMPSEYTCNSTLEQARLPPSAPRLSTELQSLLTSVTRLGILELSCSAGIPGCRFAKETGGVAMFWSEHAMNFEGE